MDFSGSKHQYATFRVDIRLSRPCIPIGLPMPTVGEERCTRHGTLVVDSQTSLQRLHVEVGSRGELEQVSLLIEQLLGRMDAVETVVANMQVSVLEYG